MELRNQFKIKPGEDISGGFSNDIYNKGISGQTSVKPD